MNRRTLMLALAAGAAGAQRASAAQKPYAVSLIGDAFDGESWLTGVRVVLDDDWKTYWRMPGDAGIPPLFGWNGGAVQDQVEVLYPLPGRYHDASGETIGYKHEVVFPVRVKPGAAMPQKLELDLFFAVCREICIPAQTQAAIELGAAMRDPDGAARVAQWLERVPLPGEIATATSAILVDGKPHLVLNLNQPVTDVFVESESGAYFGKPSFSADGREATLRIDNVIDPATLKGLALRLTFDLAGKGIEQRLTVA